MKKNILHLDSIIQKYWIIFILLLSIPAIWALFVPGFFGVSDDLHVAWLMEMDKAISNWQIPPRWVPDLSFGYGYPLFNFVYPLPFYIGDIFHKIGFSFVDSTKAVFLISAPVSMIFMYIFLRTYAAPFFALIGATLYLFAPYRAVDLYVRGAIGEIVSFMFLPLMALSIEKVTDEKNTHQLFWVAIGAISLALLILSHNITSFMFFPYIAVFALIKLWFSKKKKKVFLILFTIGVLGLLLSIYFWLPALLDSSLMKYDTVFNFIDHFPTLKQLVVPFWGYGASVPGPYDGLSFNIGVFQLLCIGLGTIFFFLKQKKLSTRYKIIFYWLLGSFLFSVFVMNFRSAFLWQISPLLPYFQFPWRFLIMTTFLTPIFIIFFEHIKYGRLLALLLVIGAVGITSFYFKPQEFQGRKDGYYANRYLANPVASTEYRSLQEEYLRLPKDTQKRPNNNGGYIANYFAPPNVVKTTESESYLLKFDVDLEKPTVIDYQKYDFPGWVAKVDGSSVPITKGFPYGQINFTVPTGKHSVEVSFGETSFKQLLDFISAASLVLIIFLLWKSKISIKN